MAYVEAMDLGTGFIPPTAMKEKGKELADLYNGGDPFPWIVIDDFLPEEVAQGMLSHFGPKNQDEQLTEVFNRSQERLKTGYNPDTLDDYARTVFYGFNSRPFVRLIENITGIKGLIPDPHFLGGGFHEIATGGHLSIHADFNHHKPLNLERRVNVLIYLNKDWKEEFGGQLELWDSAMSRKAHSLVPIFNRCVIFNTTSTSMHGNPQKVNHPDGVTRKSIALYYYTATWSELKRSHTTHFQVRPGTADKTDWSVKKQELKVDLLPPFLIRNIGKLTRFLRSR